MLRITHSPSKGTRQITCVTSGYASPLDYLYELVGSLNENRELFSKNTGLCYVERLCIRPDACPVLGDTQFLL
jgi:hypothetical protein